MYGNETNRDRNKNKQVRSELSRATTEMVWAREKMGQQSKS